MNYLLDSKNVYNLVILILILLIFTIFYNVYKKKLESEDVKFSYTEIKRFLKEKHKKPILWIFMDYEKNARNWESFYSRTSYALNQGYLFLTVRTLIEKCKSDFHICLIDDNVFYKLLDDKVFEQMTKKAQPHKSYLRIYGMCHLLYTYGGIFVPASFICFENLIRLTEIPKMFVGEFKNTAITSTNKYFSANYMFMGCEKENEVMGEMMVYLKNEVLSDFTNETRFVGKICIWLEVNIKNHRIVLISGQQLGTKKLNNKPVDLEDLFSTQFVNMKLKNILGIYVPQKDILDRIQYGWFVRMSPEQVLKSNTFLGKMLLLNNTRTSSSSSYFSIR